MLNFDSLTIARAAQSLASGDFPSEALFNACLERIERFDPQLKAFITVMPGQPAQISHPGQLAGIPIALKDLIETGGVRTTLGSLFFADHVPAEDAVVVEKLKTAGARLIGKLNMHEIALGVTGENPHYGTCRNPWDPNAISGGSSSGSAVAVAAGLCLGALGSDTGGSIRIPAALCGVVGLKPTYGRVSVRGVLPLSQNLDHVGPITRCVRDAALLLQVIAGYDPADPFSVNAPVDDYLSHLEEGVAGWRILALDDEYARDADDVILAACDQAGAILADLGAKIFRTTATPLDLRRLAEANGHMVISDAAAFHHERLKTPERFGADVRQRLEQGADLGIREYINARRTQVEGRRLMEQLFEDFDLLLLPATPTQAQSIGQLNPAGRAPSLTRFTAPFNLTGLPALSLPLGLSNGLPVAVQLVAAPWSEALLLRAGQALETALGQMPLPPRFR